MCTEATCVITEKSLSDHPVSQGRSSRSETEREREREREKLISVDRRDKGTSHSDYTKVETLGLLAPVQIRTIGCIPEPDVRRKHPAQRHIAVVILFVSYPVAYCRKLPRLRLA